ncbi:MAG: STAS domain-containing protein [Acidobacteria bacterium]|jgi:anti-anti-sigma factor|nr:STAS domain-containing protein [Acidobacteriota bacterium]
METEVQKAGSVVVLKPAGELDQVTAKELEEKIWELLEGGELHLVIDLGGTTKVAGAALRSFLMLTKKLESLGGRLALCSAHRDVQRAISVSGLSHLCSITGTRAEAIELLTVDETLARIADLAAELLGKAETRMSKLHGASPQPA